MSKGAETGSPSKLKVRLLNVAIIAALLLLLFKVQDSQSILPGTGISGRAINMTLPVEHSLSLLQPGVIAPDFDLSGAGKEAASLRSLAGEKVALVFANRDCPHCKVVLQELRRLCPSVRPRVLVMMAHADQAPGEEGSCPRLVDSAEQLFHDYGVVSVPTIYLLDAGQRIIAARSDFADDASKLAVELTDFLQQ